jgi:hypothetical protein
LAISVLVFAVLTATGLVAGPIATIAGFAVAAFAGAGFATDAFTAGPTLACFEAFALAVGSVFGLAAFFGAATVFVAFAMSASL